MARTKRRDEDADDDVLRDGECMTVKMSAMDSLQRSVAEHYGLVTDATGDSGASLHRPGYRINNTVTRDTSFYDTYDAEQAVAYKHRCWRA
jgi:hypothetical protein